MYVSISLSPRPETVSTTTSSGVKFTLAKAPKAWALSKAGMIPSRRVNSKADSNASSSSTARICARCFTERFAWIGPMPG